MNDIERELIDATEKVKKCSGIVHAPIDIMDIGKKIGVSSTFGMPLSQAMNKAYYEWKENNKEE